MNITIITQNLCSGGVQFKPMSDAQLLGFSGEYIEALDAISHIFPKNCAEIYACCKK